MSRVGVVVGCTEAGRGPRRQGASQSRGPAKRSSTRTARKPGAGLCWAADVRDLASLFSAGCSMPRSRLVDSFAQDRRRAC